VLERTDACEADDTDPRNMCRLAGAKKQKAQSFELSVFHNNRRADAFVCGLPGWSVSCRRGIQRDREMRLVI